MRILIVEDDKMIASFIAHGFRQAAFAVDVATDGEEGLLWAVRGHYDAAVIDIMLPKLDGLGLIEELRRQKVTTPVIIVSGKHSVDDRVRGLQTGGDDYLTKPFAFSELLARVHALIRRAAGNVDAAAVTAGDISLNLFTREVIRAGRKIEMQHRELTLLEYLMRNAGRVVSKTMILDQVWGYNFDPQTNVVDVLVCRLRNKIDKDFEKKVIQTIRGFGYVLRVN